MTGPPPNGRPDLSDPTLSNLFAKKFIARKDVKAIQYPDGSWRPHTHNGRQDGNRLPWSRADLQDHISGARTFGHYLLSEENQCKLFAFDIDFRKNEPSSGAEPGFQGFYLAEDGQTRLPFNPRVDWLNRAHPARTWLKYQLRMLSSKLAAKIYEELEIPCAIAYSGAKGVHVYGFTGLISAEDAREGALIVLESLGGWEPYRGKSFFQSEDQTIEGGTRDLTIEVFPKQTSISPTGLGNLMRLPLGRNLKSSDQTFFVDQNAPMAQLRPVDPIWALTTTSPWSSPHD